MLMTEGATTSVREVIGACPHDCPDTCSLVTTVDNGCAVRVRGNPAHPPTDGKHGDPAGRRTRCAAVKTESRTTSASDSGTATTGRNACDDAVAA